MVRVEICTPGQTERYDELFDACPNAFVQQSTAWGTIIAPLSPDTPYFLIAYDVATRRCLAGMPLYLFAGAYGSVLTSIPHAGPLGGIFLREGLTDIQRTTLYKKMMECAIELAKEKGCIALTVITNPFDDDTRLYREAVACTYEFKNFCQVVSVNDVVTNTGLQTGKASHNNNIRRNLKQSESCSVQVEWGGSADFEEWYTIHCKRHGELDTSPLPKELLRSIVDILTERNMGGLAVARKAEKIIGGCIYIWHRNIVDAFIMSSDSRYFDHGVNYALTYFALNECKARGMHFFNWQSCRKDSGVYTFKTCWGSREYCYSFLTWTFKGFNKVFNVPLEELMQAYRWHYLAPFQALAQKKEQGIFAKG